MFPVLLAKRRQSFVGILDTLGLTPLLAYSSTRLRGDYGGYYARIRRVSDNAELDIPFLADGTPDLAAANTFIGASSAKVTKVYSQGSRASSDMAQTTAANQPAWEASTGIPVYTAASANFLTAGANINLYANSVYTVVVNHKTGASPSGSQTPVANGNSAITVSQLAIWRVSGTIDIFYRDSLGYRWLKDSVARTTAWENIAWANTVNTTAGQLLYRNGSQIAPAWTTDSSSGTPAVPTSGYGELAMGRSGSYAGAGYYFDGHIDDVLIFDSVLTAQQISDLNTALAH